MQRDEMLAKIQENNKYFVLSVLDDMPPNVYSLLHPDLKNDKDIIYKIIQNNELDFILKEIPIDVFNDMEFAKKCINKNPYMIKFIPGFNNVKEYALLAVSKMIVPTLYKFLSDELKMDKDVIIAALKADGRTLAYIPTIMKEDEDILQAAFKGRENQPSLIKYGPSWMQNRKKEFEESGNNIEIFFSKTKSSIKMK